MKRWILTSVSVNRSSKLSTLELHSAVVDLKKISPSPRKTSLNNDIEKKKIIKYASVRNKVNIIVKHLYGVCFRTRYIYVRACAVRIMRYYRCAYCARQTPQPRCPPLFCFFLRSRRRASRSEIAIARIADNVLRENGSPGTPCISIVLILLYEVRQ